MPEDVDKQGLCRAIGRPGNGRSRQDLENRSTMTRIVVIPWDEGRSTDETVAVVERGGAVTSL